MGVTKIVNQAVQVSGRGENKAAAFASALNSVSKKIVKESDDVLVRIEPMDITVLSAIEKEYTERFLFFLFPRKRHAYEVQLNVEVAIRLVDLAEVPFSREESSDPNGVTIPFTTRKI